MINIQDALTPVGIAEFFVLVLENVLYAMLRSQEAYLQFKVLMPRLGAFQIITVYARESKPCAPRRVIGFHAQLACGWRYV